jgi:hypothetical protein
MSIDFVGNGLGDGPRESPREAVRPEMRSALRISDDGRQRLRTGNQNVDPFNIDDIRAVYCPTNGDPRRGNVDNEIDFNWKRYETYGKPDYAEMRGYHDQGWRPVTHDTFPERFAPSGTAGPVVIKDMILMERPMRLTVQARSEEYEAATRAMRVNRQKVAETPEGSMPRTVYADRSSREAIEIPIPD